ncbi:MAG: glycoside hydrolase family 125 protein [Eubacteriales bacterium]|nr:glycoside hydrolase family 125 protein [Eubacteriales bacterium]
MEHVRIPEILVQRAEALEAFYEKYCPAVAPMAKQCFLNTIETTVLWERGEEDAFVITGDIPAMWLRDSAAQLHTYLPYAAQSQEVREIMVSVLRRQISQVLTDPYANAFNESANNRGWDWDNDITEHNPWVWERKYEVDSLCAPIRFAYSLYQATKDEAVLDARFPEMVRTVVSLWKTEQRHEEQSPYSFVRRNCRESDTLPCEGKGNPVSYTGMTWSGFRPSDDRCLYGYLVPSNMMAAVSLEEAAELLEGVFGEKELAGECRALQREITEGIEKYGVVEHPEYGKIYAYETDGKGRHLLMDDANVPSLLSMPYLGYRGKLAVYENTRRFVLSKENPYFYEGKAARGVGSPHTPPQYIWPIALCMQALTSHDEQEIWDCLLRLSETHAGTNFMHEGFDCEDPSQFTRPWFAWANSLFGELLDKICTERS